jgi:hypothetical protein
MAGSGMRQFDSRPENILRNGVQYSYTILPIYHGSVCSRSGDLCKETMDGVSKDASRETAADFIGSVLLVHSTIWSGSLIH